MISKSLDSVLETIIPYENNIYGVVITDLSTICVFLWLEHFCQLVCEITCEFFFIQDECWAAILAFFQELLLNKLTNFKFFYKEYFS